MNDITIIGNLAKDPDFTITSNGTPVCRFTVAVNRRFKRAGEPDTDFFRVVTFKGTAECCAAYLAKGKKAAVSGEIHFGRYTDKDGVQRQSADLIANEVEFLSPKNGYGASEESEKLGAPVKKEKPRLIEVNEDSLPF